nr:acetyl-CoA hydrolase/transferase family protein [Nocardioides zeae]
MRPGDTVVWGQACAEPRSLVRRLIEQAPQVGGLRCFVGIPAASELTATTLPPDGSLAVHSYCGAGSNARLHAEGRLEIWPVHYSALPQLLTTGGLAADVVLVQVSEAGPDGRHSLGLADDYFSAALGNARVVIAEINPHVPATPGARTVAPGDWTAAVRSAEPPGEMAPATPTAQVDAVARRVAELVPDGATLQFGIGGLPEAVLRHLHGHRDLGIHSGIVNDAALDLVLAGVATGRRKSLDRGAVVGGLLGGTRRLFAWADRNPGMALRPTTYTHDPRVLAASHRLVAVNAAIEVDLTGAVNAESAGGRYVGAVGGAVDFLRGAHASPGGVPVVALPSTAGERSRIVHRLGGPTSTPRCEPLVVVTEHGVADLRGLPLGQRVERMLAIADPAHRARLEAEAAGLLAHA